VFVAVRGAAAVAGLAGVLAEGLAVTGAKILRVCSFQELAGQRMWADTKRRSLSRSGVIWWQPASDAPPPDDGRVRDKRVDFAECALAERVQLPPSRQGWARRPARGETYGETFIKPF
jgi:hypothetical protein